MSSRSLAEITALAEQLGMKVRITRKLPGLDVELFSADAGFYMQPVAFDMNPIPGSQQTYLGPTPAEAREALKALA